MAAHSNAIQTPRLPSYTTDAAMVSAWARWSGFGFNLEGGSLIN
jgi:hypothetical protein